MFFEAARRGDNSFFKYIITLVSVVVGAIVAQIPLAVVVGGHMTTQDTRVGAGLDIYSLGLDQNLLLALILLSFAGAFLGLYLGVRYFHFKAFRDIFTGRRRFDWQRVGFAFVFWFGLTSGLELISYLLQPDLYQMTFNLQSFLVLLLLSATLLPIQTTVEEALFRGYLMQGVGLATRRPYIALVVTSAVFGLLHFANLEVEAFGLELMMGYYIGIGLVLGIVTLMDEGTELAVGIHAATNIYSATIVSYTDASLQTPALFQITALDAPVMLVTTFFISVLFIVIAARRYQWKDWGKLFRVLSRGGETNTELPIINQ